MSSTPSIIPPPDGDRTRGPVINGLNWAYVGICIVVVGLRLYVRIARRTIAWDDYCMIIALAFFVSTAAVINEIIYYGLGRHMFFIPSENIVPFRKWVFILQSFTFFTLAFAKASVSLLLMRLTGPSARWQKRMLWFHMVFFFLLTILSTFFNLFACTPIRASWEGPQIPGARCWPLTVSAGWALWLSVYSAFLDCFLALLPISIIWKLKLTMRQKLGLCFVLGLGILSGIAAAVKAAYTKSIGERSDYSWDAFSVYCWSSAEFFLNILCGSVVTLQPLYDQLFKGKPMTPVDGSNNVGSYRFPPFGGSMGFDRFKLRSFSKASTTDKTEGSAHWPPSNGKSIRVQHSFDVESRSQDSTAPRRQQDII